MIVMRAPEVLFLWAILARVKRLLLRLNAKLFDAAEWFGRGERRLIVSRFLAAVGHCLLKLNVRLTHVTKKLENYWKSGL
jgi:hypothetical protein